jgi:integrase
VAPELPPVTPVDDEVVQVTLPFLPTTIAVMVRIQQLTGARPGEICTLRPGDIDCSKPVWVWRPPSHKTTWRGHDRVISIGPRAQEVLKKYLRRDSSAYCFSPDESEKERSKARRLARKSPVTPSQRRRKAKSKGKRRPGSRYDTAAYRRAIARAVAAANADRLSKDPTALPIPNWAPNQLRHSAATKVRKEFGLEAAQVVLGHTSADITQVYAERNHALAQEVMKQIG